MLPVMPATKWVGETPSYRRQLAEIAAVALTAIAGFLAGCTWHASRSSSFEVSRPKGGSQQTTMTTIQDVKP